MDSASDSSPFPGFEHLYDLNCGISDRPFRALIPVQNDRMEILRISHAELAPPHPLRAEWAMGSSRPSDVIGDSGSNSLLLSQRVTTALEHAGVTGWRPFPISLTGRKGEPITGYFLLQITGRCGPINDSLSEVVQRAMPARVRPLLKGLYFDPKTWDGSDVFTIDHKGYIFVTEKVGRVLLKLRASNVRLERLSESERIPWPRKDA